MTLTLEAARTDSDSAIIRWPGLCMYIYKWCCLCLHMSRLWHVFSNQLLCLFHTLYLALCVLKSIALSPPNSTALEECKFAPDRIQVFTTIYNVSHSWLSAIPCTTVNTPVTTTLLYRRTRQRLEPHWEGNTLHIFLLYIWSLQNTNTKERHFVSGTCGVHCNHRSHSLQGWDYTASRGRRWLETGLLYQSMHIYQCTYNSVNALPSLEQSSGEGE